MLTRDASDIRDEVTHSARLVLHDAALDLDLTTAMDDLPCWDSMDYIALVVEIEVRFDIQFELDEIDAIDSIGTLVRMIEAKLA